MTTLIASKARIPTDAFNRVAYRGERIRVRHRSGESLVLISEADLALLEAAEDLFDIKEATEALEAMKSKRQKPIPWDKVKHELGL